MRVTNLGPATARKVKVHVVAVPFPRTEFIFPADWHPSEFGLSYYLKPTSVKDTFDSIDPLDVSIDPLDVHFAPFPAIAKFKLDSSQVDKLYSWATDKKWHCCLLAQVSSDNDYATTGIHSWESNNLAQRNISLIRVVRPYNAENVSSSGTSFPFITGNKLNEDLYMEILIDRSTLPKQVEVLLNPFDTNEYFPALSETETVEFQSNAMFKFLDRVRLLLSRPNFKGILTLEAGSTFEDIGGNGESSIIIISQQGAEWVTHTGKRLISIRGDNVTIGVKKQPQELRQMSLNLKIPDNVKLEDQYQIAISQRNTRGQIVGGVSLVVGT